MTPPEHMGFFNTKSVRFLFEEKMNFDILDMKSLGRWTNIGFLLYKLGRVYPKFTSNYYMYIPFYKYWSKFAVYIPTKDILYIVIKKRINNKIRFHRNLSVRIRRIWGGG